MTFTQLVQFLQDHWWLAVCPAAGVTLFPLWVQGVIGAVSIGTIIWAVRKKKPEIIEAELCTTTPSTTD